MRIVSYAPPIKIIRALVLVVAWAFLATAADWTEWRGPHRDGVLVNEPKAWPEKLNLKWKIEVGKGTRRPFWWAIRFMISHVSMTRKPSSPSTRRTAIFAGNSNIPRPIK